MSISIGTDGRIVTGQTNVVIPPENAGVGDLVYKKTSVLTDKAANDTPSNFKVIGRGTADAATITANSTGYTLYGIIYSFVNSEAKVVSKEAGVSKSYGAIPSGAPVIGDGAAIMRNGSKSTYVLMNLGRYKLNTFSGDSIHPTSAETSAVLSNSDFNSSTDAQKIYGSWEEYLRQLFRVLGAPGTPFGATASGVKAYEFGRWMGKTYFSNTSTYTSSTAGGYAYAYGEGSGTWWVPSMLELGELFYDDTFELINSNAKTGNDYFVGLDRTKYYWSCVVNESSRIWSMNNTGYSARNNYTNSHPVVRPVTLLKLT